MKHESGGDCNGILRHGDHQTLKSPLWKHAGERRRLMLRLVAEFPDVFELSQYNTTRPCNEQQLHQVALDGTDFLAPEPAENSVLALGVSISVAGECRRPRAVLVGVASKL